ncbi:hypothetical protein SAMN04487886_109116, partial [Clostridium sp. DSM 8431]
FFILFSCKIIQAFLHYYSLIVASSEKIIIDGLSDIYVIENNGKIVLGKRKNISKIKEFRNA